MIKKFIFMAMLAGSAYEAEASSSDVFDILSPSVVRLEIEGTGPTGEPESKVATAIIISENGYALTATHNFFYNNQVGSEYVGIPTMNASMQVASGPLQKISFSLIQKDERLKFALIKLREFPDIKYRPAHLCRKTDLRTGNDLWATGFPVGEELAIKHGLFDSYNGGGGMWQTGIIAAPGFSGGPVSLEDGSVVGIVEGALGIGSAGTRVVPINHATTMAAIADVEIKRCRAQPVPDQAQRSNSWRLNYVTQQIDRLYAPLNLKLQKGESEWSQFQEDFRIRYGRRSPTQYVAGTDASGTKVDLPLPMKDDEWAYWITSVRGTFKPHNDSIEQLVTQNVSYLEGGVVPDCYQAFLRHTAAFNASLNAANSDPSLRVWNPRHSWPGCFVPEVSATLRSLTEKQNQLSATLNTPFARSGN